MSERAFHDGAVRLAAAARPAVENVLVYQQIDSTHAVALRLIEQAENEDIVLPPTVVIAGSQDEGQGRSGRLWVSPPDGLYLSWIAANLEPKIISQLPMIAAAATFEAIRELGIDDLAIKWPNDLLVRGRKCAGCLVHARHGATSWAAIGIGINLGHAPAIRDGSGTQTGAVADFLAEGGSSLWAEAIVKVLTEEIRSGVADPADHIATWRKHLCHREGDEIGVRLGDGSEIYGRFAGLTDGGHLRLEAAGEEHVISTGDVIE